MCVQRISDGLHTKVLPKANPSRLTLKGASLFVPTVVAGLPFPTQAEQSRTERFYWSAEAFLEKLREECGTEAARMDVTC